MFYVIRAITIIIIIVIVCGLFNDVFNTSGFTAPGNRMINKELIEYTWKEAVVACRDIFFERPMKTTNPQS
jgi:hypothetical protein